MKFLRRRIIVYPFLIIIGFAIGLEFSKYYPSWRYASLRQALWSELRPVKLENCVMTRYGSPHDGGYLLCGNLLGEIRSAYSYGIAGRDSWGCDISRKHYLLVHEYDCYNTTRPKCSGGRFEFHEECIGAKSEKIEGRYYNTLTAQIAENGDQRKSLIIKMDIEGAEVESLLSCQASIFQNIDQLVVEFHDVNDARYLEVIKFLKKDFYVVDVHFNNYACRPRIEPFPASVYEVLFVNKRIGLIADKNPYPIYPNPLWGANNPLLPDCQRMIR